MPRDSGFTFVISLSVLNDLGRKLYRSFATVLGEAISNSWDADASNVWIYINKEDNSFVIKDDGEGMTREDFQGRFLKIGYSKRIGGMSTSPKGRPYIGRKGIGKLALLSCSETVSVMTKTKDGLYVNGLIDNARLDEKIQTNADSGEYQLDRVNPDDFRKYVQGHRKGTIIYFANLKEGIRNNLEYIRKTIALYFKFSLIDSNFKIYVDDKLVTIDDLNDLAEKTEFEWIINSLKDPFALNKLKYEKKNRETLKNLVEPSRRLTVQGDVSGFVASVRRPTDLKVFGTEERIGVDLFVNGRLRERDILRHIPTAKVPENYLYGQVHFNSLDDEKDRFSTAREDVVADDEKFASLLELLKPVRDTVISDWDDLRRKTHQDGDPDNTSRISKKERRAEELFNTVSDEFTIPKDEYRPETKEKVDKWIDELKDEATFNFASYADCFVSENLLRKHIEDKGLKSQPAAEEIRKYKDLEDFNKGKGNLSIEIRKKPTDVSYLSMDGLANLIDKAKDPHYDAGLSRDAAEYKPIRDAVMHTAPLTDEAKSRLKGVFENIRGRVKRLISGA